MHPWKPTFPSFCLLSLLCSPNFGSVGVLTASSVSLTLIPVVVLTISLRITSSHMVCWFGLDCCTYWDCKGVTKRGRNHTCENQATAHHFTAPESQNTFSVCSTTPNSQVTVFCEAAKEDEEKCFHT